MRYQSNRPKRQFLAGVTCKQCGELDKTVQVEIYTPIPDEYIECVACGHTERRPKPEDLPTIQQANQAQAEVEAIQVVTFRP